MPARLSLQLLLLCLGPCLGMAQAEFMVDEAFFEARIRPVLIEHCYECHSAGAKKLQGGLRLDHREGMRRGGESGPAVVPGAPEAGTLLSALRFEGLEMPPSGRLDARIVADFEAWILGGAPDPRLEDDSRPDESKQPPAIDVAAGREFWSYRPIQPPPPPAVRDPSWPAGEIDRFILAGLEARELRPVDDAAATALLRRIYFDLIGLPPAPEEAAAFTADSSPDAYERLVDRLLASPQFGERWGRHWLDVARYAESFTLRGLVLADAWRYRDYVIESFNRDVPYDQFIREQVSGDLLRSADLETRRRELTATTFLAMGNNNLEEQDKEQLRMDVVDEQLETIGRAFLAQTIGCARCHDHKFDPIPTRDYYALAGILRNTRTLEHANVSRWLQISLPAPPDEELRLARHEAAVADLQRQIDMLRKLAGTDGPKAVAASALAGIVVDDAQARKSGEWKASQAIARFVGDGYVHDSNAAKGEKTLTFQPDLPRAGRYEVRLAYSADGNRARKTPVTIFSADGETIVYVDQQQQPPIDGLFVSLGRFRFEANGQGYVLISNAAEGHVIGDAVAFVLEESAPAAAAAAGPAASDSLKQIEAELKRLQETGPQRDKVDSVTEESAISDAQVHIRGSVHRLAERVPRGFLQAATWGPPTELPSAESGRRELGEWLADPRHPLTARVFANRVWQWLFGAGLVRTPDNFGTTGELPTHPELLDYLASRLVAEGWSVKRLVRQVVLSRTYRLSSSANGPLQTADPENRLWGRRMRRSLDAECLRDAMLAASGQFELESGGRTFPATLETDFAWQESNRRRSVYLPVFRNALPEAFQAFDFADPSVVTGQRTSSIVAPQALYLTNHPFVQEQAELAAARLLAAGLLDESLRIGQAWRLVLGRMPSEGERHIAQGFLAGGDGNEELESKNWAMLFQSLFASLDFRYLE